MGSVFRTPKMGVGMTRNQLIELIDAVGSCVQDQLLGDAASEYANDANFTSNFESHFNMYGIDAALSQASEKLYRYKNKGNKVDLIKAIGWIVLLLSKDSSFQYAEKQKD